jgi:hypothetical protein
MRAGKKCLSVVCNNISFTGGDVMVAGIADLLNEDNELAGRINFELKDRQIFDRNIKEVTIFYKLVGDARFKLFRSSGFELVFVHLTEDWVRQARIDLNSINCSEGIDVTLAWNETEDIMCVRGLGEEKYITVTAMQIDN